MTLAGRLLTEPARPARVREWPGAPWLAVGTVCVGAFMSQLDASIVTLALPALGKDLHASLGAVEWVSLSYLLVLVGTVAAVGRLADLIGRKLLYVYGFALFTLASVGCGLAPTLGGLIALRVVQALGAALLQANSVALVRTSVDPDRLHRAIGLQGAAQALGLAVGPALGGLLIEAGGWRLVFWVNLPAGVLGLVLGVLLLPRTRVRAEPRRPDWVGMVCLLVSTSLLLGGLSLLASQPWPAGLLLLAALGGFGLFGWLEHRVASPLVEPALFRASVGRISPFAIGLTAALLGYLVLFGVLLVSPLFLQDSTGPGAAGLLVSVLPLALAVATPMGALAADRFGGGRTGAAGLLLAALGCVVAIWLGRAGLPVMLGLAGAGLGLFMPANNAAIAGTGRPEQAGLISGMLNMTRGIGTALGVAVAAACFAITSGRAALTAGMVCFAVLAGLAALLTSRSTSRS